MYGSGRISSESVRRPRRWDHRCPAALLALDSQRLPSLLRASIDAIDADDPPLFDNHIDPSVIQVESHPEILAISLNHANAAAVAARVSTRVALRHSCQFGCIEWTTKFIGSAQSLANFRALHSPGFLGCSPLLGGIVPSQAPCDGRGDYGHDHCGAQGPEPPAPFLSSWVLRRRDMPSLRALCET